MRDPRRLVESWSDDFGRAALRSAALDEPPLQAKERALLVTLVATASAGAVAATATTAAAGAGAGPAATASGALGMLKVLGIMGVVGVGAVGTAVYLDSEPAAPPVAAVSARSATSRPVSPRTGVPLPVSRPASFAAPEMSPAAVPEASPTAAVVSAAPPVALIARASSTRGEPTAAAPSASNDDTTRAELAAIDAARAALESGRSARGLELLDSYATKYPRGKLSAEATVLRIEALLATGDRANAIVLAHRFLQASPDSAYAPRVQSLIGEP